MVYYGHQQNTGGKAYYFSGNIARNRNKERKEEKDLNKPDAKTTEKPDQGDPSKNVEKSAQPTPPIEMENRKIKKQNPRDEQVEGVKMELTKY